MQKIISGIIILFFCLGKAEASGRYISLAPAATEILFALGLSKEIIADTIYCNYPEEAKHVAKVGTFSEPNVEQIVSLKPDIVFTTGLEQAPTVSRLKRLGLKVVVSDPKNIVELFGSIRQFGSVTGTVKEAEALIIGMQKRIDALNFKVGKIAQDKRPKVFIEIWYDPIMTAGPGSIVDEILRLAGGRNIAFDTPLEYSRFSSETIIERNPDVIILGYMAEASSSDAVRKRMGWNNINAVRNNKIVSDINPDLLLRPSPRIIDGLEEMHKHLYNE